MHHLKRVSEKSAVTGMTSKNLAIVWAPNLIGTNAPSVSQIDSNETSTTKVPPLQNSSPNLVTSQSQNENNNRDLTESLNQHLEQQQKMQLSLVQNTQIIQFLIDNANWLFESQANSKCN